jgi:hypothetical protein
VKFVRNGKYSKRITGFFHIHNTAANVPSLKYPNKTIRFTAGFSRIQRELFQDKTLTENLDGTTSNVTRNSILRQQSGNPGYVPITILQRTNTSIPSGSYTCEVFAYTTTSSTNVICDHLDIGLIGNLY